MTEKILNVLSKNYTLAEIDSGEMKSLKASGMKFDIRAFHAEGLGHVSVMKANGFFGLMKMDTLIINPTEKDLPLYSYDRVFAMGNDTLIVELYDTLLGDYSEEGMNGVKAKEKYSSIPERDPGEHWYDHIKLSSSISKKGKKKHTELINALTDKHFEAYLKSSSAPVTDRAAKLEKAAVYVNGLIEKGGPSTDVFKKTIGQEKTRELFERILFGTR